MSWVIIFFCLITQHINIKKKVGVLKNLKIETDKVLLFITSEKTSNMHSLDLSPNFPLAFLHPFSLLPLSTPRRNSLLGLARPLHLLVLFSQHHLRHNREQYCNFMFGFRKWTNTNHYCSIWHKSFYRATKKNR